MERISPPTTLRIPLSPLRTNNKLRLCAVVSSDDVIFGRISLPALNQIHLAGASKSHSKNAFETVFGPESAQEEICSNILPDLIDNIFSGSDSSFISLGGKSRGKESILYGYSPSHSGVFQNVISSMFRKVDEYKIGRQDVRYQIRMSALQYSQRENQLSDLLSPFSNDPRHRSVRVVDDPRTGPLLENESEIRVDSPDQALFYLNTVADHRIVEDEETFRTSHLFVFLYLYVFRTGAVELEGGRRRLSLVDLGIGERNSQRGELTMPAIGNILLALFQGQKHLPSRENCLSQLLRCTLSSSRLSILLCSFAEKTDDNENIVQLASKLVRTKKTSRKGKLWSDTSSHSSGRPRSELESGSELSAAETVIFLGPRTLHRSPSFYPPTLYPPSSPTVSSKLTQTSESSVRTCTGSIPPILKGHTPFLSPSLRLYDDLCSPPGTSGLSDLAVFGGKCTQERDDFGITIASTKTKSGLDDDKRQAIMRWVDTCEPLLSPEETETTGERERSERGRECAILSHPLEDIIEQDEESMKESLRSRREENSHPLSILSRQGIQRMESTESMVQDIVSDEDALERAMAASVSSIRSHDILSKLRGDLSPKDISESLTTVTPSEMDLYRRASHLEEYATERVKELDNEKLKKKKNKLLLICCQNSMVSSGSTVVDWSNAEKNRQVEKEENEKRKNELRKRIEELKYEAEEIRKEKEQINKELNDHPSLSSAIMRQISLQLQGLAINKPSNHRPGSDSLPATPTLSHKTLPPCRTPSLTNCSLSAHPSPTIQPKSGRSGPKIDGRGRTKSRSDRRGRRSSVDGQKKTKTLFRSPYAKVTDPRLVDGPASSGRGSDDAASCDRGPKRQSYSASSGYESASGDYNIYYPYKDSRMDGRSFVDKRLGLGREADMLREKQRRLKIELQEAKGRIGQVDDARTICHDLRLSGISQATLVDTLMQENRILEKRLIACRNHTMFVTTFL